MYNGSAYINECSVAPVVYKVDLEQSVPPAPRPLFPGSIQLTCPVQFRSISRIWVSVEVIIRSKSHFVCI
jgi:hypothetical protein